MSFGIPAALLFGLVLIIASLSLFVTSKLKPNLYEDSDNIYVIVGTVCGLLLMVSLDLGAAMAFQQLLLLSATISLMWRFINLRAENKQLKNRQVGTERPKSVYNARLEDDYVDPPRERRQGKRRREVNYADRDSLAETLGERRLLADSRAETLRERQESEVEPSLSRRRNRSFDARDAGGARYDERRDPNLWDDTPAERPRQRSSPRTAQRALPEADLIPDRSSQRFDRDREDRSGSRAYTEDRGWLETDDTRTSSEFNRDNLNEDSTPRRRRNRPTRPDRDDNPHDLPTDSRSANGSMTGYVDYEPVHPEAALPPSGTEEPIVFPDQY
jgi:hypothetical protein